MGSAGSKLRFWTRPIKNYNIEQRAFKEISKEKPRPAPTYPQMQKIMKDLKNDPSIMDKGKPSEEALQNLKKVYLKSTGDNPVIRTVNRPSELNPSVLPSQKTKAKMPKNTGDVLDPYWGSEDPKTIPKGKLSLNQALQLIEKHQQDEEKWSAEVLSKEYHLNLDTTRNILEHFRSFHLHVPEKDQADPNKLEHMKNLFVAQFKAQDRPKPKKLPQPSEKERRPAVKQIR